MDKSKLKKLSKHNRVKKGRLDIDKLEKQDIDKEFVNSIKDALQSKRIMVYGNVYKDWKQIREVISNASSQILLNYI